MLELLYASGLRVSELINLEVAHVDLMRRVVHVVSGKGGKSRLVPFNPHAKEKLEAYLSQARPAFLHGRSSPYVFLTKLLQNA